MKWKKLARTKEDGGWGFRDIHLFGADLVTKFLWILLHIEALSEK